jgi:hypothetical protein
MKHILFIRLVAAGLLVCSVPAFAVNLSHYVGYTIVAVKTIKGYVTEDGEFKTSFEGCQYGRKIVFDDNTYLTCNEYGYQYAYRPDAVLLARNGTWAMVVEGDSYDMRN